MTITKYQRVTLKEDGKKGGFYDTKDNVKQFLSECDNPDDYLISNSLMTEKKLNSLHEFQGF